MDTTGLHITIRRDVLISELHDKRKEISDGYEALLQQFQDEIDRMPAIKQALVDYYIALGKGLTDGTLMVTAKGEPRVTSNKDEDTVLPQWPTTGSLRSTKRDVEYRMERTKHYRDEALGALDSSIRVLNLATDVEVRIPVGDYQRMLSYRVENPSQFY